MRRPLKRSSIDWKPITSEELRRLVDLCNSCGQCSCPNIRAGIIEAKTQFIEKQIKVPDRKGLGEQEGRKFKSLSKTVYQSILKDDGYFSSISPLKRIKVAEHTYDLGEYLAYLHRKGELATDFRPVPGRLVYYPPCHLREQEIGTPYVDLLKLIPGINLETIQRRFYCCGLGGIMGFKQEFHENSVQLGGDLMNKIRGMNPERLVTDCLSCRMQFNQLLPVDVVHPE
jgi:glycerol-3-phosphate dehydrogenase subunit C